MSLKNLTSKLFILCVFIAFSGCIDDFEIRGLSEVADILVVEGTITDGETVIILSRSVRLHDNSFAPVFIDNAEVFVEREDGTHFVAIPPEFNGRYIIQMGDLNIDYRHRLRIQIDGFEYQSDFLYPIQTPEIDSVFFTKEGLGAPVIIHVATHDPNSRIVHYRWSFFEEWEISALWIADTAFPFPTQCWASARSLGFTVGSAARTGGQVVQPLTQINPSSQRLSVLYRITVRQNAISRRAFEYFENIQRNIELPGSIFSPTPSELRGNIVSTTDPRRHVIGFIDVSTVTEKYFFIPQSADVHEPLPQNCNIYTADFLEEKFGPHWWDLAIPYQFVLLPFDEERDVEKIFTYRRCVDCRLMGGLTQRPINWPDSTLIIQRK